MVKDEADVAECAQVMLKEIRNEALEVEGFHPN